MDPEIENDDGLLDAIEGGVEAADSAAEDEAKKAARKREENEVKALWDEYEAAREFDKEARAQYAIDRRYAAGTARLDWAVSANLIGAFIDILVSFLYARNPDVSVKKTPRIDNLGTRAEDDFAKTMQLVVSSLWRSPITRLKTQCRAQVRSTLTTGIGWIKVILQCTGTNIPEMQTQLNDSRANIAQLEALKAKYAGTVDPITGAVTPYTPADGEKSEEEIDAEMLRLRELETSLSTRLEVAIRKALVVDFIASENLQVSLDVSDLTDYLNGSWMANAIYRPVSKIGGMFPKLSEDDLRTVRHYFQKKRKDLQPLSDRQALTGMAGTDMDPAEAEMYVSDKGSGAGESSKDVPFAKIVELWNRETGHVHTMIDGVKVWAKDPFQPDYPSSRFYPYFGLAFYQVDGQRHPQSLPWRLMKLMDEYCSTRSSQRLTRSRAVPGTLFNAAGMGPEEAKKLSNAQHQEYIGITPTDTTQRLGDLFAPKPVEVGDMRLYDTQPILQDMERISGVHEALQQTSTAEKTATEAEIQQSGFASRTTSDRDVLETMLSELAHYTGELALTALKPDDATRIAGAKAFWPSGMAIDDVLSLVEIEIEAGTTGKPKTAGDKEAWGVVLPLIKETIMQILQAQAAGRVDIEQALTALLQETMTRMGDESDVSRFLPTAPVTPPALPGAPGAPGAAPGTAPPGAAPEGSAPGEMPPGAPPEPGTTPPVAEELLPPELLAPQLTPPVM